jgi:beta-xylosidase
VNAVHSGYFADPFVLRVGATYFAYGSGERSDAPRVFELLTSDDLVTWRSHGPVLEKLPPEFGDEYWAPEVAESDGRFWLYYSVGRGIDGHHLRVASAPSPFGPFRDLGVGLTPGESFAIDAHPFLDADGRRYLFFARDVLDADRAGTQLAVAPLASMSEFAAPAVTVLEPNADWQLYERDRAMYGRRLDWHTLEGPSVVRREGRYWLTYSGGAWTGPGYSVAWAVADHPLGPWTHAPLGAEPLLRTDDEVVGPGHNSLTVAPDGGDVIVFHAWDEAHTARRMHVRRISFRREGPRVDGPIRGSSS